jgi:hypothetical protein
LIIFTGTVPAQRPTALSSAAGLSFTVTEYKKSFFLVTKERITFFRPSSLKKKLDLEFKDILGISVESSNVVVYDKNKNRYPLLYISNPKEVCDDLNKLLKKYQ